MAEFEMKIKALPSNSFSLSGLDEIMRENDFQSIEYSYSVRYKDDLFLEIKKENIYKGEIFLLSRENITLPEQYQDFFYLKFPIKDENAFDLLLKPSDRKRKYFIHIIEHSKKTGNERKEFPEELKCGIKSEMMDLKHQPIFIQVTITIQDKFLNIFNKEKNNKKTLIDQIDLSEPGIIVDEFSGFDENKKFIVRIYVYGQLRQTVRCKKKSDAQELMKMIVFTNFSLSKENELSTELNNEQSTDGQKDFINESMPNEKENTKKGTLPIVYLPEEYEFNETQSIKCFFHKNKSKNQPKIRDEQKELKEIQKKLMEKLVKGKDNFRNNRMNQNSLQKEEGVNNAKENNKKGKNNKENKNLKNDNCSVDVYRIEKENEIGTDNLGNNDIKIDNENDSESETESYSLKEPRNDSEIEEGEELIEKITSKSESGPNNQSESDLVSFSLAYSNKNSSNNSTHSLSSVLESNSEKVEENEYPSNGASENIAILPKERNNIETLNHMILMNKNIGCPVM